MNRLYLQTTISMENKITVKLQANETVVEESRQFYAEGFYYK